jgi:hypothetical protein
MGNSNIQVFSISVRTAICHRSSLLIEFPHEPDKQVANTTHITDTMYEGKGNSNSEPYSPEMNKNTSYILILSIFTCNICVLLSFFPVRLCHLTLFTDLTMLLVL